MMDKQTLIRKRASLKATLTVQETFFLNFTVSSIDEHELLVSRLDYVNSILPRFDEIQTALESLEEEFEVDERQIFENRFFRLVAKCRALLRESQFNPDIQVFQAIQKPPPPYRTVIALNMSQSNFQKLNYQSLMVI